MGSHRSPWRARKDGRRGSLQWRRGAACGVGRARRVWFVCAETQDYVSAAVEPKGLRRALFLVDQDGADVTHSPPPGSRRLAQAARPRPAAWRDRDSISLRASSMVFETLTLGFGGQCDSSRDWSAPSREREADRIDPCDTTVNGPDQVARWATAPLTVTVLLLVFGMPTLGL